MLAGAATGGHALAGLVRSLPYYLTFCVLAAVALPLVGAAAVPFAMLGCVAAGCLTWPSHGARRTTTVVPRYLSVSRTDS